MKGISAIAVILVVAVLLIAMGKISISGLNLGSTVGRTTTTVPSGENCGGVSSGTLNTPASNFINGSAITSLLTHTVYSSDNTRVVAPLTVTAYPMAIVSVPTNFAGYLLSAYNTGGALMGYYGVKTPINTGCQGVQVGPNVKPALMSSVSFTSYADGTAQSTWNLTVDSSVYLDAELKIASASVSCIGDPYLSNPIMVCVNGTASTLAKFRSINPTGLQKCTNCVPQVLADNTNVMGCYILPTSSYFTDASGVVRTTPALCNGGFDRRYWTVDPKSTPVVTDKVSICVFDKDIYTDDNNVPQEGYEKSTVFGTATDVGSAISCATMWFSGV